MKSLITLIRWMEKLDERIGADVDTGNDNNITNRQWLYSLDELALAEFLSDVSLGKYVPGSIKEWREFLREKLDEGGDADGSLQDVRKED